MVCTVLGVYSFYCVLKTWLVFQELKVGLHKQCCRFHKLHLKVSPLAVGHLDMSLHTTSLGWFLCAWKQPSVVQ